MKKYYSKMRKSAALSCLIIAIIFIGFGAAVFWGNMYEFFDYFFAKTDIFSLYASEIKAKEYYSCENNVLLDWYASDDEGFYYVTPVYLNEIESTYMGFYVYAEDSETAYKIVKETWDTMETGGYSQTYLSGKGYVYNMTGTEKDHFIEWFEAAGADEEIIDNLLFKTFVLLPFHRAVDEFEEFWPAVIVGGAIAIPGICSIIFFIAGGFRRRVKKTIKNYKLDEQNIAYDLDNGISFKKFDLGRKYAVVYGSISKLIVLDNLVWVYSTVTRTKHRMYGVLTVSTSVSYSLTMIDRDKNTYSLEVRNEEYGQQIMRAVSANAPFIIFGYDDSLAHMRSNNFSEMIRIVDERKSNIVF